MSLSQNDVVQLLHAKRRINMIKEAERLEDSFYEFVKEAWPQIDPAEFVDNWHLEDICNHMEGVSRGHIKRLLLNEPPPNGKGMP